MANSRSSPYFATPLLRGISVFVLVLKAVFALAVPPNGDEAYYWLWGQHLQWSYRDHAPFIGWGNGLGYELFGWSLLALRFQTFLTLAATLILFRFWARALNPAQEANVFWTMTVIYLTSPIMFLVTTNAYPDHFLVLFSLTALFFFSIFFDLFAGGDRTRFRFLYAGAVCLGLAALSKYNAVFLGVAVFGVVVTQSALRPLLRSPHLYLAGLLTIAILSPVVIWNAANGFPSIEFHAVERFSDTNETGLTPYGIVQIGGSLLALSPFLLIAFSRFLFGTINSGLATYLQRLGLWLFAASTGFMLVLASFKSVSGHVAAHWNIMAMIAFMALTPTLMRSRRLLAVHIAVGVCLVLGVSAIYEFDPLASSLIGRDANEPQRYGLQEVAAAATKAKALYNADFFASTNWSTASRFAFGLGSDVDVMTVSAENDQFKFWNTTEHFRNKSAILVYDGIADLTGVAMPFRTIRPIGVVSVKRFGMAFVDYTLFLGTDYQPPEQARQLAVIKR